jgi:hypothetical protein
VKFYQVINQRLYQSARFDAYSLDLKLAWMAERNIKIVVNMIMPTPRYPIAIDQDMASRFAYFHCSPTRLAVC